MQDAAGFIAPSVFPVVNVAHASDVYFKYPRGNFFRDEVDVRPMGGPSPLTSFNAVTDSYFIEEEGLRTKIDDRERANQTSPFNVERNKTNLLVQQHMIHRDRKFVSSFFNSSAGWSRTITGVASAPGATDAIYWNLSTGDPIGVIDAEKMSMKQRTGIKPNCLVMGAKAFIAAKNNANVLDRIKYTNPAFVTPALLGQAFDLDRVVIADAVYNSAAEGATESLGFIAGADDMLLCYAAPNAALEVPSAGYILAWDGLIPGGGLTARVDRMRDEQAHSDLFEVRTAYAMKMVAPDLGTYFSGICQ